MAAAVASFSRTQGNPLLSSNNRCANGEPSKPGAIASASKETVDFLHEKPGGEGGIRTRSASEKMLPFHREAGRLESTEVGRLVSGLVSAAGLARAKTCTFGRRTW